MPPGKVIWLSHYLCVVGCQTDALRGRGGGQGFDLGRGFACHEVCCHSLLGGLQAGAQGGVEGVCRQASFKGSSSLQGGAAGRVCVGMCTVQSALQAKFARPA